VPELPEVETVRRGLDEATSGQIIMGGDVLLVRTIAHPVCIGDFLLGIKSAIIVRWHRRGKYLLAQLARSSQSQSATTDAGWLGVHLRMTGQLLWLNVAEPLSKHTRVRLFFHQNQELRFVDQRTFGQIWWVPPGETLEQIISGLQRLGPEPFGEGFTVEYLAQRLRTRRGPIKSALLDQALVAGVGNIYADEALFMAGIHPETACAALSLDKVELLRSAVVRILETSIERGGTTFSNFLSVQGINGNYSGVAWVYNRRGQPCRICSTPIQRLRLAGRSSHFCPQCQPYLIGNGVG